MTRKPNSELQWDAIEGMPGVWVLPDNEHNRNLKEKANAEMDPMLMEQLRAAFPPVIRQRRIRPTGTSQDNL